MNIEYTVQINITNPSLVNKKKDEAEKGERDEGIRVFLAKITTNGGKYDAIFQEDPLLIYGVFYPLGSTIYINHLSDEKHNQETKEAHIELTNYLRHFMHKLYVKCIQDIANDIPLHDKRCNCDDPFNHLTEITFDDAYIAEMRYR